VGTSTVAEATAPTPGPSPRKLPPVLGRLLSGSFWLALRTPLQAVFSLWTIPLILQAVGSDAMGAYGFAWGFGFFQFLFEFGMSSALQRQVSETWTKGEREGVDRAIACGMNFYAGMALVQAAALLLVAYGALPYTNFRGDSYRLIVKLLWLQALTAPCYGLSVVVSSVLQAARRYDLIPRVELAVVVLRFLVLYAGVSAGVDFFLVVATQTAVQVGLTMGPALWVMVRELGHVPHFRGARLGDYRALLHISFYMSLVQLSVVLADKIDTTILGFALDDPGPATAVYQVVSKPFLQIRQSGWMLAYMVMPAVASLAAAGDERALERVKYDGTRLHLGLLLPIALLAWVYAGPFLTLWVGDKLGYDAAEVAPLLRLFLVATAPLVLSVLVQTGFGVNKPEVVALSALGGSLVNLPLSFYLTRRLGVSGVIWGTVLTTLFSNLLIPGAYLFRALKVRPRAFLTRTLSAPAAGAVALLLATWALRAFWPLHPDPHEGVALARWLPPLAHLGAAGLEGSSAMAGWLPLLARLAAFGVKAWVGLARWMPLVGHLAAGCLAYAAGYLAVPTGRADLVEILGKLRRRGLS
jgi:O-antigen/teichoic acid export membrane protein